MAGVEDLTGVQIIDEGNTTWNLSNGTYTKLLFIDGIGIPGVKRILEDIPQSDGAFDRGYRISPRKLTLGLYYNAATAVAAETLRDTLVSIFAPTTLPLKLRLTRNDGLIRQIDCYVEDGFDFPMSTRTAFDGRVAIPLIAPDPVFYNPTLQTVTGSLTSGTLDLTIAPGDITAGDWPVIKIAGPATNIYVNHQGTNTYLDFKNQVNIIAGRTLIIDMRPGFKTIKDDLGTNKFLELDPGNPSSINNMSGLLRILTAKELRAYAPGSLPASNVIRITATAATGATGTIEWYKRYLQL